MFLQPVGADCESTAEKQKPRSAVVGQPMEQQLSVFYELALREQNFGED